MDLTRVLLFYSSKTVLFILFFISLCFYQFLYFSLSKSNRYFFKKIQAKINYTIITFLQYRKSVMLLSLSVFGKNILKNNKTKKKFKIS